jgi:GNAT superfamily N-acetyltransferase
MKTVRNWIFHEWWSKRHDSTEVVFTWLRTHTQKDKVPFTVVALADGIPVGSCSVIENDCVFRKQYTPWVAAVFVKPEMRHRGIALAVLQQAAAIAVRAQVKGLYIDCLAVTAPVYEKNGWRVYEREVGDKNSVVMLRTIEDRSRRAEHGAPLNGGPAIRPGKSGVSGGRPSVS